jgi:hypothetical protein
MAISPNQLDVNIPITHGSVIAPYDPYSSGFDPNALTISGHSMLGSTFIGPEEFIKGEMVHAQVVVKDFQIAGMMMDPDNFKQEMKIKLALEIAEKLLENKLVEFTKQEDLHTNETTFRARAYLVRDDKVRVLRKELK